MNRSELLFLYDINDANPNGDPLDENKPRIDEETETNFVTDVRLKRTIRDYLKEFADEEIFVREKSSDSGEGLQDAKTRALDYLPENDYKTFDEAKNILKDNILSNCIDARLFGGTVPLEIKIGKKNHKGSITLTGPVQFRMGRSLHKVDLKYIKGTGAFASQDGKTQKTILQKSIVMDEYKDIKEMLKPRRDFVASDELRNRINSTLDSSVHKRKTLRWIWSVGASCVAAAVLLLVLLLDLYIKII